MAEAKHEHSLKLDTPAEPDRATGNFPRFRARLGLTLTLLGFITFLLGLAPGMFGLDRGISIGFFQIITILIGLGLLAWGASLTLGSFWVASQKSLLADFGSRVVATGYVICVFTALADAFGFGTNRLPDIFLGTLQSRGVLIGMGIILVGLLMQIRFRPARPPKARP